MIRSFLRARSLPVLALLIGLFGGCSSDGGDGGTTGPDKGSLKNPAAIGFKAIGDAVDASVAANSSIYESFEFFAPDIGSTLTGARSIESAEGPAAASCLPVSLQGKHFIYDVGQQQYSLSPTPTVPSHAVRFDLYQVDAGAPTSTLTMIGYFQAECNGQLPLDTLIATLNLGEVAVLDIELRSMIVNLPNFIFGASDITCRAPNGDDVLGLVAVAEGTPGEYLDHSLEVGRGLETIDARLSGFRANIGLEDHSLNAAGLPEPPIDIMGAGASQLDGERNLSWNSAVIMRVDEFGTISNIAGGNRAPFEFEDRVTTGNGIYACFSGHYGSPLVEGSATGDGCATGIIMNAIPLTADELSAVQRGYVALFQMQEIAGQMWIIAMQVMTP